MRIQLIFILYQLLQISAEGRFSTRDNTPSHKRWREGRDNTDCDLSLAIPENEHEPTIISNLSLSSDEHLLPVSLWPFTLFLNGTIEIGPRLNYEKAKEHAITISIQKEGGTTSRTCNIRVEVLYRQGNIHFVNSPRPFLAVVPLHPPIGLHIYKLDARYEGSPSPSSSIQYHLINQEPNGFFSVDSSTGIVRTVVREYRRGETFRLFVEAVDTREEKKRHALNGSVAVLEIQAEDRPPQFLTQKYEVEMREDTLVDASITHVKAISFRSIDGTPKEPIQYSIKDCEESSRFFRIHPVTGIVYLEREVDYEDKGMSRIHHLNVMAEEGDLSTTVHLIINITDVNDNTPIFGQPLYFAHVPEDYELGKTILRVEAVDADEGENGHVVYSIDNPLFNINHKGEISAKSPMDADGTTMGWNMYRLTVTATDTGIPPLSSTTQVDIRADASSDECPVWLPTPSYNALVSEDAVGGTPVVQVTATDPDGDQILYSLINENNQESAYTQLLSIDKDTGVIRLREGVSGLILAQEGSPLNVTVVATDDGDKGRGHRLTSRATVRITTTSHNKNKPEFVGCEEYSNRAKLREGNYREDTRVEIIQVRAEDRDTQSNGHIIYSLYHAPSEDRRAFVIDAHTGILSPSPHVLFDRETRSKEQVTVKATDNGDRPLIAFCSFSVEITDVNDNVPLMDRDAYRVSMSRETRVGTSLLSVVATDRDEPINGRITYSLGVDSVAGDDHIDDINYVLIPSSSNGDIVLSRELSENKKELRFVVIANDNGEGGSLSSSSTVTISIHESSQHGPQWMHKDDCPSRVLVNENMGMNVVLARCVAKSVTTSSKGGDNIMYKMSVNGGPSDGKFRHFTRRHRGEEWMEISMMEPLDYEIAHNYTLTLIATDMNNHVSSSRQLVVEVNDENDSIPTFEIDLFTGTIDENMSPEQYEIENKGLPIVRVHARDADAPGLASQVVYSIVSLQENDDGSKFRIDPQTGDIFPLRSLDREITDELILTVEARDSNKSSLPGVDSFNRDSAKVRIHVTDVNDNAPYFASDEYRGIVREDSPIGHHILTVEAHDKDRNSKLRYEVANEDSSKRIPFGIETETGRIVVKEKLDYEKRETHAFTVNVLDGTFNTSTTVVITVQDVNDCAPVFNQSVYEMTMKEEDPHFPRVIIQVNATDRDQMDTNGEIVYGLTGQGVGDHFNIDSHTGEIYVISSLDRDPPGIPTWKMIVEARDTNGTGLVGYADVQVNLIDINDHHPYITKNVFGVIDENREPESSEGVFVTRVQAFDLDDPLTHNGRLTYSIVKNKEIDGNPIFTIDAESGKIFAMRALDYEEHGQKEMAITVVATDGGVPQLSSEPTSIKIYTRDLNDNAPRFEEKEYIGRVRENTPIHSAILTLSAVDQDTNAQENVLTYSFGEDSALFYITTESDSSGSAVGVIRVKTVLDYEEWIDKEGHPFLLPVLVSDAKHEATTVVRLYLLDENDGSPVVKGPKEISIREGIPQWETIGIFTVEDDDAGDKATYVILYPLLIN